MTATIIIPSRKTSNYGPCVESILRNEPNIAKEDILVMLSGGCERLDLPVTYYSAPADEPFCFAATCNLGILYARGQRKNDAILLNDDTELVTPKGFTLLSQSERKAITAPRIDGFGRCDIDRFAAFVCVFIPEQVIAEVGMLDPRFTLYGYEDEDYCRRVMAAGLHINRLDDVVVRHYHPDRSTFHGPNNLYQGDNMVVFDQKWGIKREYTYPEHLEQVAALKKESMFHSICPGCGRSSMLGHTNDCKVFKISWGQ